MLALSQALNPDCDHVLGDMRALRIGRSFDAVLVHDAICHMTTEADLRAVLEAAFAHLRPGGAAVIAPDYFCETFVESTQTYERQKGDRSMRCLEWTWDPDPTDSTHTTEYVFLLREGDQMRSVHDSHVEGLFTKATWESLLENVGFGASVIARPIGDADCDEDRGEENDEVFLCHRPMT